VEAVNDLFERESREPLWMENKRVVMAIWATEVAVRKKDYRTEFPWPIQK